MEVRLPVFLVDVIGGTLFRQGLPQQLWVKLLLGLWQAER